MKIIWTFTLLMIPVFLYRRVVRVQRSIRTKIKHQWVQSGRFSLYDDTKSAAFTVTIRNLREQDSDIYHCGIQLFGPDYDTEVNLNVLKDFRKQVNTNSGTVRGYSGGNITIDYKYEEKHKNREKLVCKIGEHQCATLISISRSAERKDSGRFSINDDRSAGLLRVFIRELNVQDSGEYRITVRASEDYSLFSEFELVITDDAPKTTSSSSSSPSSSYISTSQTPLCTTVSEKSILTPSFTTITDYSLIIPLVLVLLLLIIAALLLLFHYRKHQTKGGDSTSQTAHGNTGAVSNIGCDYKEIKDTHKQLPTNPSEFCSAVYATAQLPTNPSDSCLYSNVQEASGDSQICISSAEDVNYAVVNFHKTPDCPDSVRLRNHQECSEYAAVNHRLTA
ncbi:CMRF35-like molecule 8 [Danio aesculapii]|uniref:CMRF35-like molecule 8 n=1 Tax=Danio aesculapii TaxID=1142201 RepID=UPI0024BF607E|nr:CMRF35-like molecule 8 [Danio aesculapii]